ncbi:R3H domain-containing nucleic acid-binding protein [Patulibacter sp. SYSU D01012]|uniref:Jag family protein n=1 Tax=Patulibacter sp. SYSU D01012 TaxID=2817381 RepID=UPI001B31033A
MTTQDEIGQRIAEEVATLVRRVAAAIEAGERVEVTREGPRITATLIGEQVAPFIGRHGHVIDAVQHLATRIAAKHAPGGDWVVTVDAGDYRTRRAGILERIADEAADRALRTGEPVALDPMTASERRFVHERLRERGDVDTHSEGDEPERHLVVSRPGA